MMKSLRDQSLNTPRAVRRDRRKNQAGSSSSSRSNPSAALGGGGGGGGDRDGVAASPTPQEVPADRQGLDNLLASGQELMARLTGEGVRWPFSTPRDAARHADRDMHLLFLRIVCGVCVRLSDGSDDVGFSPHAHAREPKVCPQWCEKSRAGRAKRKRARSSVTCEAFVGGGESEL